MRRSTDVYSAVCLLTALLLVGCSANFAPSASTSIPEGEPGAITGHVHGGQQPVAFATVQIWSVGTSGYGSVGTLFATTTTADDGAGSFNFNKQANTDTPYPNTGNTWACPASTNPYMYLIARGGNTQGNHNSASVNTGAVFLLAIGQCSAITASSGYYLNEVTTVGSLAALTQFFSPVTETIGSPNSSQAIAAGLPNAFSVIPTLVDITAGVAMGRISHTYTYSLAETPKINTIADVLASCMSTPTLPSTNCTTLFTNAVPPTPSTTSQPAATFPTATDTLQALWYMLANPRSAVNGTLNGQITNLYGLVSATAAPFQPVMTYQPTDWNVGITYYSVPGTSACGNSSTAITNPSQVVIGGSGKAYFVMTQTTNSGFFGMYPSGAFYACRAFYTQEARQLLVDSSIGDFWMTLDTEPLIYNGEISGGFVTPEIPYAIVEDSIGNIFYSSKSSGDIYMISSAYVPTTASSGTEPASTSVLVATLPNNSYYDGYALSLAADAGGNIWVYYADGNVYELPKASGYTPVNAASYTTYNTISDQSSVTSLAMNASGEVLFPSIAGAGSGFILNDIGHVSGSPGLYNTYTTPGPSFGGAVAVDGANNIWVAAQVPYSCCLAGNAATGYVYESTNAGTAVTPLTGITKLANSSYTSTTLAQNNVVLGPSNGIAIDPSGNVYVTNSGTNMFNTTDGQQSTVTELVGAAVPVVTPIATAAATHTFGTKP